MKTQQGEHNQKFRAEREHIRDTFLEENKIEFFQEHGELPIEYLREYDGAAEHFAKQGELPVCMGSPGALDYINADPEAFDQRVNDFKYAIAMEKTVASNPTRQESNTVKTFNEKEEHENDLRQESRISDEQEHIQQGE